jgi:hypothetical protein
MISSPRSDKSRVWKAFIGGICPFSRNRGQQAWMNSALDCLGRACRYWAGSGNRGVTPLPDGVTIQPLQVLELKRVVDREPVCNRGNQFEHPDARSGSTPQNEAESVDAQPRSAAHVLERMSQPSRASNVREDECDEQLV